MNAGNEDNNHWDGFKQFAVFAEALLKKDAEGNVTGVDLEAAELEAIFSAFGPKIKDIVRDTYYGCEMRNRFWVILLSSPQRLISKCLRKKEMSPSLETSLILLNYAQPLSIREPCEQPPLFRHHHLYRTSR